MHLLKEDTRDKVMPCCNSDAEIDDLLIPTSQMYESRENGENTK